MRKRGTYSKDLKKEIKLRIDEATFKKITEISEEKGETKSRIMREVINNGLINLQNKHI